MSPSARSTPLRQQSCGTNWSPQPLPDPRWSSQATFYPDALGPNAHCASRAAAYAEDLSGGFAVAMLCVFLLSLGIRAGDA